MPAPSSATPDAGIILKGATLVRPFPAEVRRADVRILRGQIAEVGEGLSPLRDEEVVDAGGRVVMPGFVAAHTHVAQAFAPPPGAGGPASECPVVARTPHDTWLAGARAHDAASLHHATVAGAIAALRRGVTTLIDLTIAPACVDDALEVVAGALGGVGLRGVLAYAAHDLDGAEMAARALDATDAFLDRHAGPFVAGMVGALSPGVVGEATLARVGDLAQRRNVGVHLQAGESEGEDEESERLHGLGMIERLLESGVLAPRTLLKIGAHLSFEELAVARETGCWFAWCPRTAMLLGDEHPALEHLPPDRTVLGTDFAPIDLLAEVGAGWLKLRDGRTRLPAERLMIALANTQRLAGQCLGLSLGSFAAGATADLVVLDYDPPTPIDAASLAEHLIYGLPAAPIEAVLVHGRFLLRDGDVLLPGVRDFATRARAEAARYRARHASIAGTAGSIAPVRRSPLASEGPPSPSSMS